MNNHKPMFQKVVLSDEKVDEFINKLKKDKKPHIVKRLGNDWVVTVLNEEKKELANA